jgi:hypothetical protein
VVEDVVVPALRVTRVRPPVVEELSGRWDHRGNEDEEIDRDACTHKRRGEAAERMAHDDHVLSFADRVNHGVRVLPPAGRLVLAREIDR